MKATRTVSWTTQTGRKIEVNIEKTREVQPDTANLDGDIIETGKKTVNTLYITVMVDGGFKTRSHEAPEILTQKFYGKHYTQLKAAGAYARLGDAYINEEQYNMIMAAINELEAEVTGDEEFTKVKAQEDAKEAARVEADKMEAAHYAELVKSGLCPKCGTWCYGDCEAN